MVNYLLFEKSFNIEASKWRSSTHNNSNCSQILFFHLTVLGQVNYYTKKLNLTKKKNFFNW